MKKINFNNRNGVVHYPLAGKVTVGTGTTYACTIDFYKSYANAPACTFLHSTSGGSVSGSSTTSSFTFNSSADMDSKTVMYICIGI